MNIKKLFSFLFLFLTVFLVAGCQLPLSTASHDISEVEEIFAEFNKNTDIDIAYVMTVESAGESVEVNVRMVTKAIGPNQVVFMEMTYPDNSKEQVYYLEGYMCAIMDGEYTVAEMEVPTGDNPLPTDLDLSELNHSLKAVETFTSAIYTIEINDAELKSKVEEMLGQTLSGVEVEMVMEITADKESKDLKAMMVNVNVTAEEESATILMNVDINKTGSDVELQVPSLVSKAIQDYKDGNVNPDPDPVPNPVDYEDTADGVVKYYNLGTYNKIVYDKLTDELVVMRKDSIDIYNAGSMALEKKIPSLLAPVCMDADGGKLVVGYETNMFKIFDLSQNVELQTVQTTIPVSDIVIDGSTVIYTEYDQHCSIIFYNLDSNSIMFTSSGYEPLLTINRKDHILYLTETNLSSSELRYYYSTTGELIYRSQFSQFVYIKNRVNFDGTYVHHDGKTFNRYNANIISTNNLNRHYPDFAGFTPTNTLYHSESMAVVSSNDLQNLLAIYDNVNESFVYTFPLYPESVIEMNNGRYLGVDNKHDHVAVVDVSLINGDLIDDETEDVPVDTIDVSEDGKLKTLTSSVYTQSISDDKYIYTLNQYSYDLNVYDIATLEKVYSETFLMKPESIDADSGKMVIGFGDDYQFWVYNTDTWEHEVVITPEPVYSTLIYGDQIIHAEIDQWCTVYAYNMTTQTRVSLGVNVYYVSLAINREDGTLYIGERNSSGSQLRYYNLSTNKVIFTSADTYGGSKIIYDGNFVHYFNRIYDAQTGSILSMSYMARLYQGFDSLTGIQTIFDNGVISVFTAMNNGEYQTVVYDVTTDTALYTISGKATAANQIGNQLVLFNDSTETIKTLSLQ